MTYAATYRSLDIGVVLQKVFSTLGRNFVVFLLLNLAFGVVSALLQVAIVFGAGGLGAFQSQTLSTGGLIASLLSGVLLLAQVIFIQIVVAHAAGQDRKVSFGECVQVGASCLAPSGAILILRGIAVFVASLLFLIPGVILALVWQVAVPAQVSERVGVFTAFSRSAALTRDNRLMIFVIGLIVGVINGAAFIAVYLVGFLVVGGIALAAGLGSAGSTAGNLGPGAIVGFVVAGVIGFALYVVAFTVFLAGNAAVPAAIYGQLRAIKEGAGGDQAKVFT